MIIKNINISKAKKELEHCFRILKNKDVQEIEEIKDYWETRKATIIWILDNCTDYTLSSEEEDGSTLPVN